MSLSKLHPMNIAGWGGQGENGILAGGGKKSWGAKEGMVGVSGAPPPWGSSGGGLSRAAPVCGQFCTWTQSAGS